MHREEKWSGLVALETDRFGLFDVVDG